jgi:MFS family permease
VAIAGFFPGMVAYLSLWYRKEERTMRIIIFYSGAIAAGAIGGILVRIFHWSITFYVFYSD